MATNNLLTRVVLEPASQAFVEATAKPPFLYELTPVRRVDLHGVGVRAPSMATMPTAPATLGAHLERDRLEERAARLDRVITALRARVRAYDGGAVPPPLSHSLTDFEHELSRVQSRLAAHVES